MTNEQQLKLQAFFDGELPEAEAREVAALLARDAEATALLGELKNTRKALDGFEKGVTLPESREFFWSKIQREIERSAPTPRPVESVSVFAILRRWLVPASAVAALAIVSLIATKQFTPAIHLVATPSTVTKLADSSAFTYQDKDAGVTLVWFSVPADKNPFAEVDGATILQ